MTNFNVLILNNCIYCGYFNIKEQFEFYAQLHLA